MYVHFWGGICHFNQYNISSSNTAWALQTMLYWYYIYISEKFNLLLGFIAPLIIRQWIIYIKNISLKRMYRTPELWTWKLWIEAWLQAVTNHNCPDELPLVIRCIWFWEEASLGFYRIYVWNNYFICAFLELR